MANRNYYPEHYSLEPQPVTIWAKVTFGASGAPTLTRGKGIKSVSRSSAGVFVFTFGAGSTTDKYNNLLGAKQPTFVKASAPSAPLMEITTDAVAASGAITVTLRADAAGAATDPANGEIGFFEFVLNNSSAV
jgi:hypothetical protein